MKLVVCHSPNVTNCGITVYGQQLDRAFLTAGGVDLVPFSFREPEKIVLASGPGTVLLVHAEPSFFVKATYDVADVLRRIRMRGAKIVFCCHWFSADFGAQWAPFVDVFVVHRDYPGAGGPRMVEIPLGCQPYTLAANRTSLRARYGLPAESIIVTTIGFLAQWKRLPLILGELLSRLRRRKRRKRIFLQVLTPLPCDGNAGERRRVEKVLAKSDIPSFFSTDFRSDAELMDRVHVSDLGFLFHGEHTGSVSAATKTFVSARTPFVITQSTHASDIRSGVVRVPGFDPGPFADVVNQLIGDPRILGLRQDLEIEYARLSMDVVTAKYLALFRSLL